MKRLEEQRALVTGGTRGIGRAIAARLADEGASVWITGTDEARAEAAAAELDGGRGRVRGIALDVTDPDSVKRCFGRVHREGALHILVNNAGISRDRLLMAQSRKEWRMVLSTNLDGLYACCHAAIRPMLKARYGRIVNLSSVVGIHGNAGQAAYAAAKAGIIGFTKAFGKEVARRKITVNAVAPGLVETDMTSHLTDAARKHFRIPVARAGSPEEVAAAVAFLASPEASYIVGAVLEVTGGLAL